MAIHLDVLIIGGGAAGLWLLDELHRRDHAVLLIERDALGAGQTIASQGIIHGGVKYTLSGSMTAPARAVREMPALWRHCLAGRRQPDLRGTRVLADRCCLWRTDSLSSRLGLVGARAGLRSEVTRVESGDRPLALTGCPGAVFRVDEPVIDLPSFLATLSARHRDRLLRVAGDEAVRWDRAGSGMVHAVTLRAAGLDLVIRPEAVVLTAGAGNAELRAAMGLTPDAMQRRPLHMVMLRGRMPELFGHCVDGAKTRVTITTAADSAGRAVWHVGGQIAEDGVRLDPPALVQRARRELGEVLPGVGLDGAEWATYRVDRAEAATERGARPAGPAVRVDANVLTAWPTKLALVSQLVSMVLDHLPRPRPETRDRIALPADWPRPEVALPPWETCRQWQA